jgi:hypothetical protein
LKANQVIEIEGYKWFGHNRANMHVRAKTGSGGIGFLIKDTVLDVFNVSVLDCSSEGILWLKMCHKFENSVLVPCVCYLPPINSSRGVDANAFFDTLITNIYNYQDVGLIYICGDFNSRCGNECDYICGVDNIEKRNVIDYKVNSYGHLFTEFLINCNMCMLNGRNNSKNDFTCVYQRLFCS